MASHLNVGGLAALGDGHRDQNQGLPTGPAVKVRRVGGGGAAGGVAWVWCYGAVLRNFKR